MKKILLLLVLATGFCQAQITFADPYFKEALLSTSTQAYTTETGGTPVAIDVDGNGEIEISEAQVIKRLIFNIMTGFDNMAGIEHFSNLVELDVTDVGVHVMDVSTLLQLKKLRCGNNFLATLNVGGLTNLEELVTDHAYNLTTLSLSSCHNLKSLSCLNNSLTSLILSPLADLEFLNCADNSLTALDVTPYENLTFLRCHSNSLTSLNVSTLVHLEHLDCGYNQLTALNVSMLPNLKELNCGSNPITSLNLDNLALLESLDISDCPIPAINLAPLSSLKGIGCYGTLLPAIDLTPLTHLESIFCGSPTLNSLVLRPTLNALYIYNSPMDSYNLGNLPLLERFDISSSGVVSVDVSNCPILHEVSLHNNSALEYVNVKNGVHMDYLDITMCPNLALVCAEGYPNLQNWLTQEPTFNNPYVQVNSYCSFTPGGVYNTLNGTVLFDNEGDGCDSGDTALPYVLINIHDGADNATTGTTESGQYHFYKQLGNFTITPQIENPEHFTITPASATVNFTEVNNSTETRNFCVTPNGIHPDAEISIVPLDNARPGFDAHYELVFRNKGNQTVSGTIALTFDDARTDLVSSTPAASQIGGTLNWTYTDLAPFETRMVEFVINLNGPMETPALNDGDILNFSANMGYYIQDVATYNTTAALHQIIVNSLDPNDKTCLEGNTIAPEMIGNYVHYNINFENIGTAPAQNIVVKDVIDTTKFDIASLQVIHASHPVVTRIDGNKVEFIFENINLPGTSGANKGNVLFKIKTKPTLVLGNTISNKAEIFFDYNFPIETNEATSTFAILKNNDFVADATIGIYPNPTKSKVNVKADSIIKSLQLFDLQGRILQTSTENAKEVSIDLSGKQNGIYLLNVTTEKGSKVEKLIKE